MGARPSIMPTESQEKICRNAEGKRVVQLMIKCRVEKFKALMDSYKPGKDLWSEGVSSRLAQCAVWKLRVHPNGDQEQRRGYISVFLNLTGPMKDNGETLKATCHIYLLTGSDDKIDVLGRRDKTFGNEGYDWGSHVSHDLVKEALHADGSVLVAVDIEFLDNSYEQTNGESDLFTKWQGSVSKLLGSGDYSDCTLMVGGEELKAHRLILSAISPTFGKMFGNEGFQEARDGIVRIEDSPGMLKDISAKPYKALLSYAYTGYVDWAIFGDCKRDVLVVACKYFVLDLKHHVEKLLINEIAAESFAELALLADTYSCDQLKKACFEFLSSNYSAVVLTPQWGDLTKTRGDLARELLRLVREDKATASTTTAVATDGGTN